MTTPRPKRLRRPPLPRASMVCSLRRPRCQTGRRWWCSTAPSITSCPSTPGCASRRPTRGPVDHRAPTPRGNLHGEATPRGPGRSLVARRSGGHGGRREFGSQRGSPADPHAGRSAAVECRQRPRRQMHAAIDVLEAADPDDRPSRGYAVVHAALASAIKVIARADDSSGIIGDACRRLLELHPDTAAAAGVASAEVGRLDDQVPVRRRRRLLRARPGRLRPGAWARPGWRSTGQRLDSPPRARPRNRPSADRWSAPGSA